MSVLSPLTERLEFPVQRRLMLHGNILLSIINSTADGTNQEKIENIEAYRTASQNLFCVDVFFTNGLNEQFLLWDVFNYS